MIMEMMESNGRISNNVKKEKRQLQVGDRICLKPGMRVYADIPGKHKLGSVSDENTIRKDITIGRLYTSELELTENVLEKLKGIVSANKDQIAAFIESLNINVGTEIFDTAVYAGEYEVHDAQYNCDGNSFWCGYPNGWHVYCHKVDDPTIQVDFYQNGFFTAMVEEIQPINR